MVPGETATTGGYRIDPIAYRYRRPVLFYFLATAIPWACWFTAAYLSNLPTQTEAVRLATAMLGIGGLLAPVGVVWWMVRGRPDLRADIGRRLRIPHHVPAWVLACTTLLLPASILAAMGISLLFGYSAEQFAFRGGFSFTAGLLPAWLTLVGAAFLEEFAWHGYGTDALISRMRVLTASLVFTVIWALWHLPLSFIKGYYHQEVVEEGWLHALNFPLSMVAFVILMNWLYFRGGRNIWLPIVFHLGANLVNEIFMTDPDAKLIQTALLLVLSAIVVLADRDLFLRRPHRPKAVVDEMSGPAAL